MLDRDLDEQLTIHMQEGRTTGDGYSSITLRPGVIDDQARSLYGYKDCHYLASAVSCMATGWSVVTLTGRVPDRPGWTHLHSGAVAPDGTVLDIHGAYPGVEEWHRSSAVGIPFEVRRHDGLRSQDVPELVAPAEQALHGNRWWWLQGIDARIAAAHQHFARELLSTHGYAGHLRPEAHSHRHSAPAPPPSAATTTSTASTAALRGPVMSIQDIRAGAAEVAQQGGTVAQQIGAAAQDLAGAAQLLAQLTEGSAAPELADALGQLRSITDEAEALPSRIHAAVTDVESYAGRL